MANTILALSILTPIHIASTPKLPTILTPNLLTTSTPDIHTIQPIETVVKTRYIMQAETTQVMDLHEDRKLYGKAHLGFDGEAYCANVLTHTAPTISYTLVLS